ncbi:MAG: endolytic transglycosylase MltG [Coriobacteriia bacterium]|nr:endolytic transglycosylase MltG [Coriobacteriia bacterium]
MTSAKHTTYKSRKRPVLIIAAIVAFVAVFILIFNIYRCSCLLKPGEFAEITVDAGATVSSVGNDMERARLILSSRELVDSINSKDAASKIKIGTYNFEGGKSVDEYADILISGSDAASPKIVVSEGMRLKDIADTVKNVSHNRISSSSFIEATKDASKYASDYPFLKDAGNKSLEGFLMPKTYNYKASDKVEDIVRMMLDQFKLDTQDLDLSYPQSKNLNFYDVVILASIVEKESQPGVEKKVASVFYNRLAAHMQLNSDATTAYYVGHDPSPEEVHADNAYSTYTNYGLPPTPICSPGLVAIDAVCHPEETDYFFFFFKGNDYAFSKTFEEHQDNIVRLR